MTLFILLTLLPAAETDVGIEKCAHVWCVASDACHRAGICDPATGACSNPPAPDGATCSDGNICTGNDVCQAGSCVGSPRPNGSICKDRNVCTQADVCWDGVCIGEPISGASCNDDNTCTQGDFCLAGVCRGTPRLDGSSCHDRNPCTKRDLCRAGVCTGINRLDGAECELERASKCTSEDGTCQAGVCTPKSVKTCAASDECHVGVCDSNTGGCFSRTAPEGTACGDPSDNECTAADACDGMGTCQANDAENPGTTTCGVGACEQTFDNCVDGVPQTCTPGASTPEVCGDGLDNDCDGVIDNGFNLAADPNNCGSCDNRCTYDHAFGVCIDGQCEQGDCEPGWNDTVPGTPGCEYECNPSSGGVEICDGRDNDCDGLVDDGNPGGGVSCGVETGECSPGTTICSFGVIFCVGGVGPAAETCNNLDDDCNGVVDNGFDKVTDPRYCDNCAGCSLLNAVPGCFGGNCTIADCLPGWTDLNGVVSDGCEYSCTNSGEEVCDGLDNNCDGVIDDRATCPDPTNACVSGECIPDP